MVQKRLFILVVMLFIVASCKIDRKSSVDRDKFTFRYTDDSYLFFRNVRQIYYDFQDLPRAGWHAYRYADRYQENSRPSLHPVIVIDWMNKQANLLVEPNDLLQSEDIIRIRETNQEGRNFSYELSQRGRANMLEFATKIYEGIMSEHTIYVFHKGKYHLLFPGEDDTENFRVVMGDYYRLTGIF